MKRAFTLMEVNLAVFIMAVGVLAMVALYPLGFRENQQSREDVAAAAVADAVFAPIVAALSSTNVYWSEWCKLCGGGNERAKILPSGGWSAYCRSGNDLRPQSFNAIKSTAGNVLSELEKAYTSSQGQGNPANEAKTAAKTMDSLTYALVATPGSMRNEEGDMINDFSRICLSLRVTRRPAMLFSQSLFYTEVHFQGDPNK